MAYRESERTEPCHQCEEATSTTCPSCRLPTCAVHIEDEMCRPCRELFRQHANHDPRPWLDLALGMSPAIGLMVGGFAFTPLFIVGIVGMFAGPSLVGRYRTRRRHERLRTQLRETGRLPEPPGAEAETRARALAEYEAKRLAARSEVTVTDEPD
jgi:hypothetical protein